MHDARDVSVVVPAFQSERWIAATIASIRAQTLAPREIIVVDNGSSDDTAALAAQAGAQVLVVPGGGPSRARNAGIAAARSPWIAFCDADDLWTPDKLARHAVAAERCPDVVATFSDWVSFDERGPLRELTLCNDPAYRGVRRTRVAPGIVRLDRATLHRGFYRSMFVLTSAAVFRRDVLEQAGPFDERLRIAEDYDLFLRVFALGPAAAIEEPLVRYRRHPQGISGDGVVNALAHADLWRIIETAPQHYPAGALEFVRRERVVRPRMAGEFAARRGRFREARALLGPSVRSQPAMRAAFWYGLSLACDNPVARPAFALARRAWTQRPWRYSGTRTKDLACRHTGLAHAGAAPRYDGRDQ